MAENLNVNVTLTASGDGLKGALRVSQAELDKLTNSTEKATEATKRQSVTLRSLRSNLFSLKSAFATLGIGLFIQQTTAAAVQMERFKSSMRAAVGGAAAASDALRFVREESDRLGISFQDSVSGFTKLAAAAKGTSLEGQGVRKTFTAISEASRVLGLSSEQTKRTLTALEQIISKGKVSAEELRQQLGEQLPGAFQISARAMGVTTQKLDEMLQNGELLAEEFIPKLSDEITKTFANELPNAINTADAEFNRFANSMLDLKVAFGNELLPTLTTFARFMSETYIPNLAYSLELLGFIKRDINNLSEGALILRRDDLQERADEIGSQLSRRQRSATRSRLQDELAAITKDIGEIDDRLKTFDELNKKIVEMGREAATAAGETNKLVDAAGEVSKEFTKERDTLLERLATVNDNTEAARILFETSEGGLKDLTAAQKEELKLLAERVDILKDTEEVRRYMRDQELKRQREFEAETKRAHEKALRDEEKRQNDQLKAAERHARQQQKILLEPFKNALEGIQDAFADTFEKIFSGGVNSFSDLGREIKSIFIRLASEIAALLVFQPIVRSILGSVGLSGLSSSLGLSSASGGSVATAGVSGLAPLLGVLSGGAGGGFGVSGLTGGLGLASGLISGFQSPLGASIGIGIADKLGLGAFGQSAFAGAGLNAPFSLLGAGLNSLLGINNGFGSTAGGLIGGGLGSTIAALGSFGGPVGAVAGTVIGGLLGGLFGGKPSREVSHAAVRTDAPGAAGGFGLFKNAAAGDPRIESLADAISKTVNAELERQGKVITGFQGVDIREVLNAGEVGDKRFQAFSSNFIPGIKGGNNALNFESDDPEAFVKGVADLILNNAATKADPSIAKAEKAAQEESAEAARAQARALLDSLDVTKLFTNQVQAIINQFVELRANAKTLGLTIAEINAVERGQLQLLRDQQESTIRGLVSQGRSILGIEQLTAFRDELSFGSLSTASPLTRLSRARSSLDQVSAAALRGDVDAINKFPDLAQSVIGLARDTFASGPEFQSIFTDVNTTLNQVIEKQRALEQSLLSDITITLQETSADQIAAIKEQTKLLSKSLEKIDQRLRKVA